MGALSALPVVTGRGTDQGRASWRSVLSSQSRARPPAMLTGGLSTDPKRKGPKPLPGAEPSLRGLAACITRRSATSCCCIIISKSRYHCLNGCLNNRAHKCSKHTKMIASNPKLYFFTHTFPFSPEATTLLIPASQPGPHLLHTHGTICHRVWTVASKSFHQNTWVPERLRSVFGRDVSTLFWKVSVSPNCSRCSKPFSF